MGCDDCWICRSSYPDSITINNLTGYGGYGDCCANLLGTFATSEWGEQYDNIGGVTHRSFGTTVPDNFGIPTKSICEAIWSGRCVDSPTSIWRLDVVVGTHLPTFLDLTSPEIAANPSSTRVTAKLYMYIISVFPNVEYDVTRIEYYTVDLPKPCPQSGVFTLAPVGTPSINTTIGTAGAPVCWRSTDFLHSVTIEITAP